MNMKSSVGEDGIACYYSRVVIIFQGGFRIHTLERVAELSDGGLDGSGSRLCQPHQQHQLLILGDKSREVGDIFIQKSDSSELALAINNLS